MSGLDPDPLTVPDRLVQLREQPRKRRLGCWIWPYIVLAFVLAAPAAPLLRPSSYYPDAAGTTATPETVSAPSPGTYTGIASWYAAPGDQAAVPWWRPGQSPLWAVACRFADGLSRCVTVLVTGWCQCLVGTDRERVADLSDHAFRQLAPLSAGLIRVTLEVGTAGPGLPATDTEEPR